MRKGSVTIFLSLVLILVLSFIFSMLEGARMYCLKGKAQLVTDICMQSVFSNYHSGIWEDYHLLFLDGTWQSGEFSTEKTAQNIIGVAFENLATSEEYDREECWDFTKLIARNMEIVEYELATDHAGTIFRRQVSLQMQKEAVANVLDYLFQMEEQGENIQEQQKQKEETWQQAWDAMGEAQEMIQEQAQDSENIEKELENLQGKENIFQELGNLQGQENISNESGSLQGKEHIFQELGNLQGQENISNESGSLQGKEHISKEPESSQEHISENIEKELESLQQQESISESTESEVENPMEYVKELKNASLLTLVLEDTTQLSSKAVENGNFLLDRQLLTGTRIQEDDSDELERLWLQYYIENYFSSYVNCPPKGAQEKALSYEIEYILAGKNSDKENLEEVVSKLLAVREIMNFTTIMQDIEKKSLALSIATATVGFTGILPLIKAVQAGILLSWVFVESVLDVRALLAGETVPFLKTNHQWKSDLTNCRKSIQEYETANKDETGWNYNRYLQMLLLLQSKENISYRCMDVIERNEQVQMDTMIQTIEGYMIYQASPLFWNLNTLVQTGWDEISLSVETSFSYGY